MAICILSPNPGLGEAGSTCGELRKIAHLVLDLALRPLLLLGRLRRACENGCLLGGHFDLEELQ